jgi:hypothetical protein
MLKDLLTDCYDFRCACRHLHDVNKSLSDDLADLVTEIGERAIASVAGLPGAAMPKAMSASLASAIMKARLDDDS